MFALNPITVDSRHFLLQQVDPPITALVGKQLSDLHIYTHTHTHIYAHTRTHTQERTVPT